MAAMLLHTDRQAKVIVFACLLCRLSVGAIPTWVVWLQVANKHF